MPTLLDKEYLQLARSRSLTRLIAHGAFEGTPALRRGKILDPVVQFHLNQVARHWKREDVTAPIFVVGIGRSGTTLLSRILSLHPTVGFLHEPRAFWQTIRPDQDIFGHYAPTGRVILSADDATDEVRQRARRLFSWFATVTRSDRVLEKTPFFVLRLEFLRALFPDAKIVGIARHPSAVVPSMTHWSKDHGTETMNWWGDDQPKWLKYREQLVPLFPDIEDAMNEGMDSFDYVREITEWLIGTRVLADAVRSSSVDGFIWYEDLVRASADLLPSLMAQVDLSPDERCLTYAREAIGQSIGRSARQDSDAFSGGFAHWDPLVESTLRSLPARLTA
jgi:hypothetical protein